jgi:hypothetical protein
MIRLPKLFIHRVFAALAFAAPGAGAHEFWIMPDDFTPDAGGLVRVQLFHGERFAGDVVARSTPMIARFELLASGEGAEVRGMHEASVSFVRAETPGIGTIVYESEEYINLLPAAAFETYLREEGLGEIARRRAEQGETGAPGREAYVRCAKAIVAAGLGGSGGAGTPPDAPVGLPLEIVLESGLHASESEQIGAKILFEGAPIEGVRVVAVHRDHPGELHELSTDADGRVTLPDGDAGVWMLTALHMTRVEDRDDIDWKSYWASLTFERVG